MSANADPLTVTRHPNGLRSGELFFFVTCLAAPFLLIGALSNDKGPLSGTYMVMQNTTESLIVAGDSREANLSTGSKRDDACKIITIDEKIIFFAIGIYNIGGVFDVFQIARDSVSNGASDLHDIAARWATTLKDWFLQAAPFHLKEFNDRMDNAGDLVTGIFSGSDTVGDIEVYKVSVQFKNNDVVNVITRLPPSSERPFVTFGYIALAQEFFESTTARARAANAMGATVPANGTLRSAQLLEQEVKFIIEFSGDPNLGGTIPVIILERGSRPRWFRRPDFCPEK